MLSGLDLKSVSTSFLSLSEDSVEMLIYVSCLAGHFVKYSQSSQSVISTKCVCRALCGLTQFLHLDLQCCWEHERKDIDLAVQFYPPNQREVNGQLMHTIASLWDLSAVLHLLTDSSFVHGQFK